MRLRLRVRVRAGASVRARVSVDGRRGRFEGLAPPLPLPLTLPLTCFEGQVVALRDALVTVQVHVGHSGLRPGQGLGVRVRVRG